MSCHVRLLEVTDFLILTDVCFVLIYCMWTPGHVTAFIFKVLSSLFRYKAEIFSRWQLASVGGRKTQSAWTYFSLRKWGMSLTHQHLNREVTVRRNKSVLCIMALCCADTHAQTRYRFRFVSWMIAEQLVTPVNAYWNLWVGVSELAFPWKYI